MKMKHKIYSTAIVNELQSDFDMREVLYRNQHGYKRKNLLFHYTYEEIHEFAACQADPIYFFEKYCYMQTYDGLRKLSLRQYQKEIIKDYFDYKFNIVMNSRQTGLSTIQSLLIIYDAIFTLDKNIAITDCKLDNAKNTLEKVKTIYQNLPFFLKPGVIKNTSTSIVFDNGNRIRAYANLRVVEYNIHSLFMNNFTYMHVEKVNDLFRTIFPVIAAIKNSKLFICSTPNGYDKFYEIFTNAQRKEGDPAKNIFNAKKVYWWEVPGRDEKWKELEMKNLGEEVFNREYDLKF